MTSEGNSQQPIISPQTASNTINAEAHGAAHKIHIGPTSNSAMGTQGPRKSSSHVQSPNAMPKNLRAVVHADVDLKA